MAEKLFVLDTNVLIHDHEAIYKFPRHDVVIPLTVIEELDHLKRNPGELGKNARAAIRELDALAGRNPGTFCQGALLENGSKVRIEVRSKTCDETSASPNVKDNWIIMSALLLQNPKQKVIFVSKDLAARIKAHAFGLEARDYENYKVNYDYINSGYRELEVTPEELEELMKAGAFPYEKIEERVQALFPKQSEGIAREAPGPIQNEYYRLHSQVEGELREVFTKYDAAQGILMTLRDLPSSVWGLKAKSHQQCCALDMLLDDKIQLVNLVGMAGTGKTLLALAAALRKVFDEMVYNKVLVSRPIIPLGKDLGYLPGTKEEKLFHWMQPIYDNLEFLCSGEDQAQGQDIHAWILNSKKIEMEAVTFIRGRSLPKIYFIVDEAQNLTPHEVKTIISRAGEGTKVVLTGDPTQIDHPYLDRDFNALTYTSEKFKNQSIFGHVKLAQTERSNLASLCAKLM